MRTRGNQPPPLLEKTIPNFGFSRSATDRRGARLPAEAFSTPRHPHQVLVPHETSPTACSELLAK